MAALLPESFQLVELLGWLDLGIIGATLAGLVAGATARKRQPSVGSGLLAGFVTAAIILGLFNPDGGRWWLMWAAMGSVIGAGAGAGAASLVGRILENHDRAATTR